MHPSFPPIGRLYLEAFRNHAAALAVVDGAHRWTYSELGGHVARLIGAFDELGLKPGDALGLALGMSADYLALHIAAQMAGLCTVELTPQLPPDALAHRVRQANVSTVLVRGSDFAPERLAALPGALDARLLAIDGASGLQDFGELARTAAQASLVAREHAGAAFVAYTSGSTGLPKAAAFDAGVASAQALMLMATLDYPERPVAVLNTAHPVICAMLLTPTLMRGGTVVTRPTFDLEPMLEAARAEGANVLFLPTQLLYVLLGRADADWLGGQVDLFFYGGESITPPRLRDLIGRFGRVFAQAYGAMEAGPAAVLRPQDHDPDDPEVLGSMGRPLHGTVIDVLGPHDELLGTNEVGRIAIRSPARMQGYLGLPEKTREAMFGDALLNGDVGFRDARGYVHLVDRSTFAIERDGRTVYPREIERQLAEHRAVRTSVVMPVDVDGQPKLCAVVLLQPDAQVTPAEFDEFLAQANAPRLDRIVCLHDLPLNPVSGKADRPALAALLRRAFDD